MRFLTSGGTPPDVSVADPPPDSATLGAQVPADGLTVTVGVGASLFDGRYGLAPRKPARLTAMPVFPNDGIDGSTELHGDISLQICADSRDTVMHALRDITRHTRAGAATELEGGRLPRASRARAVRRATSSGSRTASLIPGRHRPGGDPAR